MSKRKPLKPEEVPEELREFVDFEGFGGWESTIYFIQAGSDGPVKVGCSMRPDVRLSELQAGSAEELRLVGQIEGGLEKERWLHGVLRKWHLRGEWFRGDAELLALLKQPDLLEALWSAESAADRAASSEAELRKLEQLLRERTHLRAAHDRLREENGVLRQELESARREASRERSRVEGWIRCPACQKVVPILGEYGVFSSLEEYWGELCRGEN